MHIIAKSVNKHSNFSTDHQNLLRPQEKRLATPKKGVAASMLITSAIERTSVLISIFVFFIFKYFEY